MVWTNAGRNVLRDAITSDFNTGQAGSNGFPANASQTGLFTPASDTLNTLSSPKVKSANTITVTHVVTTSEANGVTLREWEVLGNSSAVDYNRIVTSGLLKDANTEISYIQTFVIERI